MTHLCIAVLDILFMIVLPVFLAVGLYYTIKQILNELNKTNGTK